MEQVGQLDEGFLSEAKGDEDKPGLLAMLQKVLQLYASTVLSKRSYAKKGEKLHSRPCFCNGYCCLRYANIALIMGST
ncbi:hypothetical protein MLD38_013527 [Melastoma candidum]|uniref:Uncharacterized protein n=1 Tax=Melastoma candidum TaxID=119954 RepID=A0ACB9RBQ1_9MYRT|nr:hypothetical protein MLD38_013527 [Melastoma candidum]